MADLLSLTLIILDCSWVLKWYLKKKVLEPVFAITLERATFYVIIHVPNKNNVYTYESNIMYPCMFRCVCQYLAVLSVSLCECK